MSSISINYFELAKAILPMVLAAGAASICLEYLKSKFDKKLRNIFAESSEERIDRLTKSLKEASNLSSQIEDEITRRQKIAEELKTSISRYEELTKLKESEVEAVVKTLRCELQKEGKKSFIQSAGLNIFFFIAGIAASYYLK